MSEYEINRSTETCLEMFQLNEFILLWVERGESFIVSNYVTFNQSTAKQQSHVIGWISILTEMKSIDLYENWFRFHFVVVTSSPAGAQHRTLTFSLRFHGSQTYKKNYLQRFANKKSNICCIPNYREEKRSTQRKMTSE